MNLIIIHEHDLNAKPINYYCYFVYGYLKMEDSFGESVLGGEIEQVRQISNGRTVLRDVKRPYPIRMREIRVFGISRHDRIGEIVQAPS